MQQIAAVSFGWALVLAGSLPATANTPEQQLINRFRAAVAEKTRDFISREVGVPPVRSLTCPIRVR